MSLKPPVPRVGGARLTQVLLGDQSLTGETLGDRRLVGLEAGRLAAARPGLEAVVETERGGSRTIPRAAQGTARLEVHWRAARVGRTLAGGSAKKLPP